MQILAFVKNLLPKFGKDRLQEDINICKNELQNTVIPSYEAAASALSTLQSKEAKEFEKLWFTYVKTAKKGSLVTSIQKKLQDIQPMLDMVENYTQKEFESEIIVAGMTVLKSTLVRMIEIADFTTTYSLRFLNYLYVLETTHILGEPGKVGSSLTPGEINLIKTHFVEFCIAVNALAKDPRQAEKVLETVPEILVNTRGEAALKVFGESKVDPLNVFQVKGFTHNPIYRVGLMVAEFQANRYKKAKELKSILELRLLNLQQIKAGNPEAQVDREIDIIQSRIDALDEKIRKAEESV